MKWHKLAAFVVLLSLCVNFAAFTCEKSDLHMYCYSVKKAVHICENIDESKPLEYVRVQTSKVKLERAVLYSETVQEISPSVPENYKCIVVEPKNRVQEARRNVDEYGKKNISSI